MPHRLQAPPVVAPPPGTLELPRSVADAASLDLAALPTPKLELAPCDLCHTHGHLADREHDAPGLRELACSACDGSGYVTEVCRCADCEAPLVTGERGSCRACVAEAYEEIVAKVAPRSAVLAYTAVLAEPTRRAVA